MNASWRGLLTGVNAFCSGLFTVSDVNMDTYYFSTGRFMDALDYSEAIAPPRAWE